MEKEKIKLSKAIVNALEHTLNIPYYKEDTVEKMMEIQESEKKKWIDQSHMLNELSPTDLYKALTDGYEVTEG